MSSRRFFFIHIPKTAGTSFRHGLSQTLGDDSACYDYGPDSEETSDLVKKHCYQEVDFWRFQMELEASDFKFLGGHVLAQRYVHMMGAPNTLTFIREPAQRIISEYKHFVRHHDYLGSVSDFIHLPRFQNLQHKKLQHVPLTAYGFIGLTESYDESIKQINALYDLQIPILETNTARDKLSDQHDVSDDVMEDIARLNELDYAVYQKVSRLYQLRLELFSNKQAFTRGEVGTINKRMLSGWAVRDHDDNPIPIRILINDVENMRLIARDNRPMLKALGLGRGGYIGFQAKLPKLKAGDTIRCLTADTHQELLGSPLKISRHHL